MITKLHPKQHKVDLTYPGPGTRGEPSIFIDKIFKMGPKAKSSADTYHDMCDMECLNEAELLENLRIRFEDDLFLTYIGPTLLAINPYCLIKKLYTPESYKDFQWLVFQEDFKLSDRPPHNYAIAAMTFKELMDH